MFFIGSDTLFETVSKQCAQSGVHNIKTTMKQIIFTLAFILTTFLCFGQNNITHLQPARDFSKYTGNLKEYYDGIFPLLYKGFSEKPIARYTAMPAFFSQYSFSIESIDGKEYVVSNTLSENYWYARDRRDEVKLISSKAELQNDLYLKIVELFKLLEEQTKEIESGMLGLDGVTYFFATTDTNGEVKIGETWSPQGLLLNNLVKICDNIYALGKGDNVSQTQILKDIDRLTTGLKQQRATA